VQARAKARDDSLIGGILAELVWDWLHIKDRWVAEEHRGQAAGSRLLEEIIRAARSRGIPGCHLKATDFLGLAF